MGAKADVWQGAENDYGLEQRIVLEVQGVFVALPHSWCQGIMIT